MTERAVLDQLAEEHVELSTTSAPAASSALTVAT
jgi:hypothetical protein